MAGDPLYINGRFTTTAERVIGVEDRGLQFGDGIYEVMKFRDRRPIFVADHLQRLERGLRALEIRSPWTDEQVFLRIIEGLLAETRVSEGIIYVQVTRGECERAHFYPDDIEPTVILYTRAWRFPDAAAKQQGVSVITAPDIRWQLCDVKSVNLLGNVLAKQQAKKAGVAETILIREGRVTEGASSTFFAVREGRLVTHPADEGILPGTVRDHIISLAIDERIRVDERPILENELFHLDEAFLTSTSQSVMPIVAIDGRPVRDGRRGPVTERLQRRFDGLEAGG